MRNSLRERVWAGLKRAAAAAAAVATAACTTTTPAPDAPRPALWKIADEDTTIYLFGTIHLLPEGLEWRTPALEKAIAASDTLVLETDVAGKEMEAAQTMMKLALSPGLPPLIERVPPEKREELAKLLKSAGIPEGSLDKLETWAAALTVLTLSYKQAGLSAEAGVERGLDASYRTAKRKVIALETVEQQFGFFDGLSEGAQRALLVGMLDDPKGAEAEFQAMLKAWKSGDTDAIARTFDSETALSPELRQALMTKRNAAWADWLAKRLDQPGTVLVAVGAGHLAGKDSVQRMLSARGLRAERVQ